MSKGVYLELLKVVGEGLAAAFYMASPTLPNLLKAYLVRQAAAELMRTWA